VTQSNLIEARNRPAAGSGHEGELVRVAVVQWRRER